MRIYSAEAWCLHQPAGFSWTHSRILRFHSGYPALVFGADLQVCDKEGATPLHYAKNPEIIRLLLSRGLSVHARDLQGNTPFHYQFRNLSAARILLEHGADVNSRNNMGIAPVHRVRNVKELAFLYYHGADLSAAINDDEGTSIFYLSDDPAIQQFIRNHKIPVHARRTSEEPEEAESSASARICTADTAGFACRH